MKENQMLMMIGAGLIAYYFLTQKKGPQLPPCDYERFKVDSVAVCEDELIDLGYIYWDNRADGPNGWYDLDDFNNTFNIPPATWIPLMQDAAETTKTPSDPLFSNSQGMLSSAIKSGATPLVKA